MIWILKYRQWLIIAAAIAAVSGALMYWGHARYVAGVRDERARAEAVRVKDHSRTAAITQESSDDWSINVDALNSRITAALAVPSVPAIRLCVSAPAVRVPAAALRPDAAPNRGGQNLRVGPDISSAALVQAGQCERDRRQLIALQRWVGQVRE